jgi:YidC/Oxa1 family membrane protein insertase
MWVMRKINPSPATAGQDAQTAASMKMMDLVMPGMTLFLAFSFSGMLGLYWVYQSILGLANSLILAKLMPIPKFTEDEIKELRRQEKEVEKAARAAAKKGPRYRSLHYIDDEDYDELPPLPKDKKGEDSDKRIGGDIPEIKD